MRVCIKEAYGRGILSNTHAMNHHEMMAYLATQLREGFPEGELEVDDREACVSIQYISEYTESHLQLLSFWKEPDDEEGLSSVQIRPLSVLGHYATTDDRGMMTLRLPCGTQYSDGDTSSSVEYDDGLGNVCWYVPMGDREGLARLTRGLAVIAAEFYASEILSTRLADALGDAFPSASVRNSRWDVRVQFEGRGGRTATVQISLENVCSGGSGQIIVRVAPVWLFDPYLKKNPQGSDEGDLTAVFANGSSFTNCEMESEGPDGVRSVYGFFQYTREQEEFLFLGDMYQFVLCASRVASLVT